MRHTSSILVFVTQYMPTGGIESHLREFCLHLTESGVEVDLVITNSRMLPETELFFRQNCRRVYVRQQGRSSLRFIWLSLLALKLRFNQYDALYTNGQGNSISLFAKLTSHYEQWVHHHHTAGDEQDQASWGKSYRKTLQQANRVIACSQRNATTIGLAVKRKVDTIPCFSRKIDLIPSLSKQSGEIRFGYYGRLIPEKGIDILCQLSEDIDLQGIKFHLWGEGPSYSSSSFEKFLNIVYHGPFYGRDELTNVLGSLDALLLLSTHPEGLPISLLEAMSAGLPWLATDRGGIPDIALDPTTTRVIAVSSDYSHIKKAVVTFANDLKTGQVSNQIQLDLYAQKFSPRVLISQWKEILHLNGNDKPCTESV